MEHDIGKCKHCAARLYQVIYGDFEGKPTWRHGDEVDCLHELEDHPDDWGKMQAIYRFPNGLPLKVFVA